MNVSTHAMPPRPENCPAVGNIKSAGLSYAVPREKGYTVMQINQYGTNDNWLFGFSSVKANSSQEALSIGRQWLITLLGSPQPVAIPSQNVWACLYQTIQGSYGVTITPVNLSAKINQSIMAAIH